MNQEQLKEEMLNALEEQKDEGWFFVQEEIFEEYAEKGCVEAMYRLGKLYYDEGMEDHGLAWFTTASEHGHAEAFCKLGHIYSAGFPFGVKEDWEKAWSCYLKAAELGDAYANYEIGVHYNQGWNIELDEKKAFEYFMKAAEMKLPDALNVLSYIYKKGNSVVEKDLEKALEYAQMAYIEKE